MSTPTPALKPTAKAVKDYFAALAAAGAAGASHELAVRHAFEELLAHAARPLGWTLVREKTIQRGQKSVRPTEYLGNWRRHE
jgi:hypothetical protein